MKTSREVKKGDSEFSGRTFGLSLIQSLLLPPLFGH
jgi:hypothetical protein